MGARPRQKRYGRLYFVSGYITASRKHFRPGRADGRTDRRTDGRTKALPISQGPSHQFVRGDFLEPVLQSRRYFLAKTIFELCMDWGILAFLLRVRGYENLLGGALAPPQTLPIKPLRGYGYGLGRTVTGWAVRSRAGPYGHGPGPTVTAWAVRSRPGPHGHGPGSRISIFS